MKLPYWMCLSVFFLNIFFLSFDCLLFHSLCVCCLCLLLLSLSVCLRAWMFAVCFSLCLCHSVHVIFSVCVCQSPPLPLFRRCQGSNAPQVCNFYMLKQRRARPGKSFNHAQAARMQADTWREGGSVGRTWRTQLEGETKEKDMERLLGFSSRTG